VASRIVELCAHELITDSCHGPLLMLVWTGGSDLGCCPVVAECGSPARRVRRGCVGNPKEEFSAASRRTNRRSWGVRWPPIQWPWAGSSTASLDPGATARWWPGDDSIQSIAWDSNRVSSANTARSAQDSHRRLIWRCNTATLWRSTRVSAFFDCAQQASSPSQPMTFCEIRHERGRWRTCRKPKMSIT
jgi:hypothetical protein